MVDKRSRTELAQLIRRFMDGSITNDQFVDSYPRSPDRAISAIETVIWFAYDDLHEHRLTGKYALTLHGHRIFENCILFLGTDLEYSVEASFIGIFASVKRLWRWISRTEQPEPPKWWPFDNQEQLSRFSKLS
jgi:hypothetical protein